MYHPAKVLERIDTGDGVVFLVETWDENTFTLNPATDLDTDAVEDRAIVLLDYYPDPDYDLPTAKQVVAAVLDEDQGERIWSRYKELYENAGGQQTAMMQPMGNNPFDGGYIG